METRVSHLGAGESAVFRTEIEGGGQGVKARAVVRVRRDASWAVRRVKTG